MDFMLICTVTKHVGDSNRMFLGCKILIMLKSNQICSNFITFAQISLQFCPNFASILSKSNSCIPSSYDIGMYCKYTSKSAEVYREADSYCTEK